ncbi:MAG: family 16 glycosylhydrolase, partial [Kiritimatiellae bacterium]|nr:family 16 glycosylhydrolase [Kiritimatiellia bacterium]
MRKTIVAAMFAAAALASGSLFAEDHVVTFRRLDGTILERRTVPHGGTTTLPAAPSVPHFRFKEWDRAERLACVTNALDLWALYENDGSKTWAANTKIESKSIAERDEQYTLEEYFKMYDNLEWTDEFSRGSNTAVSVNTSNWGYDTANRDQYSCETSGNNQAETNGYLALTVRREPWTRWGKSYNFTSGGIRSDNKVAFRYGRCEVRAKLTRMPGVAPAFWMMGSGYNTYPKNGEIDIFEQPSGGEWAGANMHVPTPGVQYKSIQNNSQCAPPDGVHFGDGFHRFGIIINERELVYYVDNHIFKRIDARDDRYEMIRRCYQFIVLGVGIDDGWLKDGPGLALSESDIPSDFQSVDFLVDYCRIYTNTKENNTVALEPPPAAAKLSGPVKSAVWYGQSLIWGMPGYQVMTRNIDKLGWSSMYIDMYTRTAIETFVKQEKPDVITFLTMPSQSPTSNTTPFAAPGMSSISISANANAGNEYDQRLQLFAGYLYDSNRFSPSDSSIDAIKLSDDVDFTNCVAVCADLVENATGARVKVVGVNVIATNGVENANGVVGKGFSTLFTKLNEMKDDNVILFFQGMNWQKYDYIKKRAKSDLDSKFGYIGKSEVYPAYQFVYATENVSASSSYPAPLPITNPSGTKSCVHTNHSYCATVKFSEPESQVEPDRVLYVPVAAGATNTLNAADVTSYITNIVKQGAGVLVASAIPGYTGTITVEGGVWQGGAG